MHSGVCSAGYSYLGRAANNPGNAQHARQLLLLVAVLPVESPLAGCIYNQKRHSPSKFRSRIAECGRPFNVAVARRDPEPRIGCKNRPPARRGRRMPEGRSLTFSDPDDYATAFGGARVNLTITGAGDFAARLTRLRLQHLEVYSCRENLPRVAYVSLPPDRAVLSFPVGAASLIFGRVALRTGDMVFHSRGERVHQRSKGACQWGLISLSAEEFAKCGDALNGQPIASPLASRIHRPPRADAVGFRPLCGHA